MRFALSLFAAAAILFGCDEEASFRQRVQLGPQYVTTRQGCQVWDPFPKAGETADWTGPCVAGYAEGYGLWIWKVPNPRPQLLDPALVTSSIFDGTVRHGLEDGPGTLTVFDLVTGETRVVETGHWQGDLLEGDGSIVHTHGSQYAGGFHLGRFEGQGIAQFDDGSVYRGTFHDGLANGSGKLTEPNGLRYEGGVLFGLADGHGAVTLPDGTRYEGDFHLGVPDGQGRLVAAGAQGQLPRTFEGQWHGGCLTGSEPLICLQNKSSL